MAAAVLFGVTPLSRLLLRGAHPVALGVRWPALPAPGGALRLGFVSDGLSLLLFVLALRRLGSARTGAWFALAPFVGAALAVPLLGERPPATAYPAAALMALGLWLHLTERHDHAHTHAPFGTSIRTTRTPITGPSTARRKMSRRACAPRRPRE